MYSRCVFESNRGKDTGAGQPSPSITDASTDSWRTVFKRSYRFIALYGSMAEFVRCVVIDEERDL